MINTDWKTAAKNMIISRGIKDENDKIGILIYCFCEAFHGLPMNSFYAESNKYCYQLTNGKIDTVLIDPMQRILLEINQSILTNT